MLLHRVLFMAAVLFPSLSNVFGFSPKRLPPVHVCPALQGKGFSKESNDAPKLGKDAAKILREAKGSLEVAQGIYFQSMLKSLKETDPEMYAKLEGYSPNNFKDETSRQAHAKLVEYTWDTVAAYLPVTSSGAAGNAGGAAIDSAIFKKLEVVAQAACFNPNLSVLDVGCGNGAIVGHLQRAGADLKTYLGLDLSSQMIASAKASHPGVLFDKANFLTLTCDEKKFDTVLFNGALQFFPNTSDALKRAALMLKPGGRIVIAHVNGAGFVRSERRGNPNTVLADMPDVTYVRAIGEEIGAKLIGLQDIAPTINYDMDSDIYLCALQMQ